MSTSRTPVRFADKLRDQINELEAERSQLSTDLDGIEARGQFTRADTAEVAAIGKRAAAIKADIDAKAARVAELDALEAERAAAPSATLIGSPYSAPQHMRRTDPFGDTGGERDRALALVDRDCRSAQHVDAAKLEKLVDSPDRSTAGETMRYILATGRPEYRSAFDEWLRHPTQPLWTNDEVLAVREVESIRAAMSLTTANGGAMVPYILDPTVMLTNSGTANPIRSRARVETIAGANEWRGVTSAGVNAEWLAEGAEAADASPTFAQPTIPTFKGFAYLFGSYEVLSDSSFGEQLPTLLFDAKDRLEATAHALGNGTTAPQGLITGLIAGSSIVTSTTTDVFAVADLYKTQNAVPARFRKGGNSSWLGAIGVLNLIRAFDTTGGSSLWARLGENTPGGLLGDAVDECSDMDGTITALADNYVLVNGDIRSAYIIVDRIGMELVYDSLVLGANRRPTGQAGFVGYFRTGGLTVNAAAARVLNVT